MFGRFAFALTAVLVSSNAFAAGLSSASQITITPSAKFNAWSSSTPTHFTAHGVWAPGQSVSCTLTIAPGSAAVGQLKVVSKEVKQDGYFYTSSLSQPITALVKKSTSSVVNRAGWCNGEPELCDPNTYNDAQVDLLLSSNQGDFQLSCSGNGVAAPGAPNAIEQSQVNIPGIVLQ